MRSILLFTLQIKRSCTLIQPVLVCKLFGGGKRDRTDDPLLAKQVLYQLSYAPSILFSSHEVFYLRLASLGGSGRT